MNEFQAEARRYAQAYPKVTALASKVVSKSLTDIQGHARTLAPVDTGNLRGSIHWQKTGALTGYVQAGADYAIYQEHGTAFQPGTPFMGPATERIEPFFVDAIAAIPEAVLNA